MRVWCSTTTQAASTFRTNLFNLEQTSYKQSNIQKRVCKWLSCIVNLVVCEFCFGLSNKKNCIIWTISIRYDTWSKLHHRNDLNIFFKYPVDIFTRWWQHVEIIILHVYLHRISMWAYLTRNWLWIFRPRNGEENSRGVHKKMLQNHLYAIFWDKWMLVLSWIRSNFTCSHIYSSVQSRVIRWL